MKLHKPLLDLAENILAGTRAAMFMPVHLWSFKGGYLQVCLLLFLSLSLSIVEHYYNTAPDNYFNPYGLSYQALLYLLFFFSLSLIAFLNSRLEDLNKLVILFLSVAPVIWLGTISLSLLSRQQTYFDVYRIEWTVFIIYALWYLLVVARLIKRFFYLSILPTSIYVVLYAIINITPLFVLPAEPLWTPLQAASEGVTNPHNIDVETIYYSQNKLLDKAIENMVGGKAGVTDLFFIGFAGDADEDVFMNEAKSARTIMDNHFNTFGHSLILINNEKTVDSVPLANGHNLKSSIKGTAKLMNIDEDMLVLFLTSHASEDHYISVNFLPLKLNNLNAETINTALNAAGIKWRIIIISACYSGGFIKTLTDPYTLIITAAKADRNSFGCGHDGQYTYFGDAYLENGLKQTKSFIEAFDVAKKIISEKEDKEGFKNSDPQIMIGSKIENKLLEYEKGLEATTSNNWAMSASH